MLCITDVMQACRLYNTTDKTCALILDISRPFGMSRLGYNLFSGTAIDTLVPSQR